MDKEVLKHSLKFMTDSCPSDIGLVNCSKIKDENGFIICSQTCLNCWGESLTVDTSELLW